MGLTLGNLDTRFKQIVGDATTTSETDRFQALADADVELSSIKGFWRVRGHDYTISSSPAMAANSYQLTVPTSPAFESPYRLYYRESGVAKEVKVISRMEWLERSNLSIADYPRFACIFQTASGKRLDLDRLLSSAFVANIATLTLEYFIEITRLTTSAEESILPDSLRHHILPVAGVRYALGQGDLALADRLRPDAELAREAVLKFDIEHIGRPRQIRPLNSYGPQDGDEITSDYGSV